MPKLNVETSSQLDAETTFNKLEGLLTDDAQIKSLDPQFAVTLDKTTLTGTASGKFFKGSFEVKSKDDTSSKVVLQLDLPMAMLPFKGKIRSTLEGKLQKALS